MKWVWLFLDDEKTQIEKRQIRERERERETEMWVNYERSGEEQEGDEIQRWGMRENSCKKKI